MNKRNSFQKTIDRGSHQKFRKQYSAMLDELECLREENARLKGIAERVKTAMAAAGF